VVLPGAYAPASIALRVTGAGKPLHDKAVVLEEEFANLVFLVTYTEYKINFFIKERKVDE
jgi:hypothetical protein